MRHGPRIIIKDDRDSSIQRGCVLYAGHFRPELACIIYHAAQTAPHEVSAIIVSEGWRKIRDSRDLHEELRAFDLSLNVISGDFGERRQVATSWADRMRKRLGEDYEIIVHGKDANLHIHVELDP